jgi:hypothetical protein
VPLLLALACCTAGGQQPSIWPPADFALHVEEVALGVDAAHTLRRFRVAADGIVVYGVATGEVVDATSGTALPVFGCLCVYELVPTCTRALTRRIARAGVLELAAEQGQREGEVAVGTVLRWRAFDRRAMLTSRGRVHGEMAEILAVVAAHLPAGEAFATPGVAERGVGPVLRGVPELRSDPAGALQACLDLLAAREDEGLLLDAFALATSLGRAELATGLLARWRAVRAADAELTAEILSRMTPAGGA